MKFKMQTRASTAEILVLEDLGVEWDGMTAADFIAQFRALGRIREVNIRIDSQGGSLFQALSIYNFLMDQPVEVTTTVDGMAASAATLIMLAGDVRRVAPQAFVMIHEPWGSVTGTAAEMREQAAAFDKIAAGVLDLYADRTGADRDDLAAMMEAETWMDAEQALASGFATEISGAKVQSQIPHDILQKADQMRERVLAMRQDTILARAADLRQRVEQIKR